MHQAFTSDIKELISRSDTIPRESFNYYEYKFIQTESLRLHFINSLNSISLGENNFFVFILDKSGLKGFLTCEFLPFDSDIFGFNVYKISNIALLGSGYEENEKIIYIILNELEKKIKHLNIRYLVYSLNQNLSYSRELFNTLIKSNFYYVNTLLTFKMEKEEFSKLHLYDKKNDKIQIRTANIKDKETLYNLAYYSFKINRFHLDKNLDRDKCNLLHSKSLENSMFCGYADIIYVAELENEVVGYYSGKKHYEPDLDTTIGSAIISAVNEKARGMGVFSTLNNSLLRWFHENTDLAEMGTYINNQPVHKVWAGNRLTIIRGSIQLARFVL